jgi:hypothetical protein
MALPHVLSSGKGDRVARNARLGRRRLPLCLPRLLSRNHFSVHFCNAKRPPPHTLRRWPLFSIKGHQKMQELLAFYIRQRANLSNDISAIGHQTVIKALRFTDPYRALAYLEHYQNLNRTNLTGYQEGGLKHNWEGADMMRKVLPQRIRLYTHVIAQIKKLPEYQPQEDPHPSYASLF